MVPGLGGGLTTELGFGSISKSSLQLIRSLPHSTEKIPEPKLYSSQTIPLNLSTFFVSDCPCAPKHSGRL